MRNVAFREGCITTVSSWRLTALIRWHMSSAKQVWKMYHYRHFNCSTFFVWTSLRLCDLSESSSFFTYCHQPTVSTVIFTVISIHKYNLCYLVTDVLHMLKQQWKKTDWKRRWHVCWKQVPVLSYEQSNVRKLIQQFSSDRNIYNSQMKTISSLSTINGCACVRTNRYTHVD